MYSYPRLSRANLANGTGYLRFCVRAVADVDFVAAARRAPFAARTGRFVAGAAPLRRGATAAAGRAGDAACARRAVIGAEAGASRVRWTSAKRTSSPTA